jgi:hypothetical protein
MEEDTVTCIVCETQFSKSNDDKFQQLEYFDDSCICNECLRKEREGYPVPEN